MTSGATAVRVVWSSRRGSRDIEHIGSAHDEAELEALKTAARQRLAGGQGVLTWAWRRLRSWDGYPACRASSAASTAFARAEAGLQGLSEAPKKQAEGS